MRPRTILVAGCVLALAGAATPGLAQGSKQVKAVLEKLDVSAERVVIRETHGHKGELPLMVDSDTKIMTPTGSASLAALRVGDEVTVSYGPGAKGEVAKEIDVTKPASSP